MIYKSIYSSPLGYVEICADTADAVTRIYFTSTPSQEYTENALTKEAAQQIAAYFAGKLREFDFPLALNGSSFEKEVWNACRSIPYGEARTFRQLAAAIGDDKAARAVGQAVEANPLMLAVPSHRVIGKTGILAGLSTDAVIKEALLGAEKQFLKQDKSLLK